MDRTHRVKGLFVSTALLATLVGHAAYAQTAAPGSAGTGLEEVVVTATRQTNTVNRVALSIAAVTQRTLDEQGIKQAQDLTRVVPGLNLTVGDGRGASSTSGTFSIRGVGAAVGAATTGVYLDDTSLSKRANTGTAQINGAPLPVLFDLDRVEVLKGPQGTLYGGSSEGGAIRFITPAPSLTRFSGLARAEVNTVEGGGIGYEFGAAVGGPIVADKLGFRISGLQRRTPGYVDAYSAYTGELLKKDGNGRDDWEINPQLLWQPTDRLSAKLSVYWGHGRSDGGPTSGTSVFAPNGQIAAANQTFTTPQVCTSTVRPATLGFGVAWNPAIVACPAAGAAVPASVHVRPGMTYGPWRTGKDINLVTTGQGRMNAGVTNDLRVSAITLAYRTDWFTATSITSLVNDVTDLDNTASFEDPNSKNVTLEDPVHQGFPLFSYAKPGGIVGDYNGGFISKNKRQQVSQEIRLTSPADSRPLSWVAGLYYSDSKTNIGYRYPGDGTPQLLAYYGIDDIAKYGIDNIDGLMARLDANIDDREIAGYADVNYWLTSKLKLEAGVRYADDYFSYYQLNYGQFSGRLPSAAASLTRGVAKSTPIAPKFGVEYQFTPDRIVYANAAKGFRAGGVNPAVSQSVCDAGLTALGITAEQIPPSYGPDDVWSYELGEKFRLLDNRLQLNGAVYRIDWSGVQATVPISCGFNFVMNGGRARSEGFDLQTSFRPVQPLTLSVNASYTNARYLDPVAGPNPKVQVAPSINAGDGFNIPKWQVSASGQYDTPLAGPYSGYLRLDYQWQDAYLTGTSYGTASFNPYTYHAPAQSLVNTRVGVRRDALEVSFFVNNLLGSRTMIGNSGNGKTVCNATTGGPNCSVFVTYSPLVNTSYQRPRAFGLQANYRF
jgi:iron complex outermembrane receptor protein